MMKPNWMSPPNGKRPQGRLLGALAKTHGRRTRGRGGKATLAGIDPALVDSVTSANVSARDRHERRAAGGPIGVGLPVSTPRSQVQNMSALRECGGHAAVQSSEARGAESSCRRHGIHVQRP